LVLCDTIHYGGHNSLLLFGDNGRLFLAERSTEILQGQQRDVNFAATHGTLYRHESVIRVDDVRDWICVDREFFVAFVTYRVLFTDALNVPSSPYIKILVTDRANIFVFFFFFR
jgi:hypothetical protein